MGVSQGERERLVIDPLHNLHSRRRQPCRNYLGSISGKLLLIIRERAKKQKQILGSSGSVMGSSGSINILTEIWQSDAIHMRSTIKLHASRQHEQSEKQK